MVLTTCKQRFEIFVLFEGRLLAATHVEEVARILIHALITAFEILCEAYLLHFSPGFCACEV